jgi:hypothetical protein
MLSPFVSSSLLAQVLFTSFVLVLPSILKTLVKKEKKMLKLERQHQQEKPSVPLQRERKREEGVRVVLGMEELPVELVELILQFIASKGWLSVVQWARANGCPWDERYYNGENGCPWNGWTCSKAASGGRTYLCCSGLERH